MTRDQSLGSLISRRLTELDKSRRWFTREAGVTYVTATQWVRDAAQPSWENCVVIANALDVDETEVRELAGYTGSGGRIVRGAAALRGGRPPEGDPTREHHGAPVIQAEQIVSARAQDRPLSEIADGARYVQLQIPGESMSPDVLDNDWLTIDLEANAVSSGKLVIALIGDDLLIGRLRRIGRGVRLTTADGSTREGVPESYYPVVRIIRLPH